MLLHATIQAVLGEKNVLNNDSELIDALRYELGPAVKRRCRLVFVFVVVLEFERRTAYLPVLCARRRHHNLSSAISGFRSLTLTFGTLYELLRLIERRGCLCHGIRRVIVHVHARKFGVRERGLLRDGGWRKDAHVILSGLKKPRKALLTKFELWRLSLVAFSEGNEGLQLRERERLPRSAIAWQNIPHFASPAGAPWRA